MMRTLARLYFGLTLRRRWLSGLMLVALLAAAGWFAQDFRLDASADSLILENDQDLRYYRDIAKRYGESEFVVVAYTPDDDLFSDEVLSRIAALRDELAALKSVASVTSLLDVPLIDSPRVGLSEVQERVRTLEDPDTDHELARREFATSPIYQQLLTDAAGESTAMLVTLKPDEEANRLLSRREDLRLQQQLEGLSAAEEEELSEVSEAYSQISAARQAAQQQTIAEIRAVLDRHRQDAHIVLGGVPMIASDMIDFVRADIRLFSALVGGLLLLLLAITFGQLRWVLIPAAICASVSLMMVGMLGLMQWPVTVVSSNFTSLTLIISLSLVVHLIVRYNELRRARPQADKAELIRETVSSKFAPSLFTSLTTIVSFGSLVIADIRPVIDFGLMMVGSVITAFVVTFLLFPWLLNLLPAAGGVRRGNAGVHITSGLAAGVEHHGRLILFVYLLLGAAAVFGLGRLGVENRFIDYFKDSTEIHKGMVLIDKKLGGTTPLDVIIDAPASFFEAQSAEDEFDDFADEFSDDAGLSGSSYWYNSFALERAKAIHDYLDALPETGKVLSMASTMEMITMLNKDEPPDNFTLAVMHGRLPPVIKAQLFDPYMSEDGNQLRFAIRVIDSDQNLRRDALLKKIRADLANKFELEPEQVHLAGALVLYNNVLQSLFDSQIQTLAAVFLAIAIMLAGLFRSPRLAIIGVLPTVFAALSILGLMGWLDIPLDIMTITIAAITIGIGVDDTIHYTHRFQHELSRSHDRWQAMRRTHASVGRAVYLTTVIVTLGFSILALSNFVPIVVFGLFTGLSMMIALIANLTLLPLLLVKLGPTSAGP